MIIVLIIVSLLATRSGPEKVVAKSSSKDPDPSLRKLTRIPSGLRTEKSFNSFAEMEKFDVRTWNDVNQVVVTEYE